MRTILCAAAACLLYSPFAFAGGAEGFDHDAFRQNFATAQWLVQYDRAAWLATERLAESADSALLTALSREWFAAEQEPGKWVVVFGGWSGDTFKVRKCFGVDLQGTVSEGGSFDAAEAHRHATAIRTVYGQVGKVLDSTKVRFNHYVRRERDSLLTVYLLPAFQSDMRAVYGAEFIYTTTPSGAAVAESSSYTQNILRGFSVVAAPDIKISYPDVEQPPLGAIYFTWYFKEYFQSIIIETSKYFSVLGSTPGGKYYWSHNAAKP